MNVAVSRRVISIVIVAVALTGSSAASAPLPSGAIAVPTDDDVVSSAQSGILCDLGAVIPPVIGVLKGNESDSAWPVWLEAADGRPLYVRWPRGFSVRFDPDATLLDENGAIFLLAGSPITLGQVVLDPAGGTREHPFVAAGLVATGIGHQEHCYTSRT